jgi:hypothetical protein
MRSLIVAGRAGLAALLSVVIVLEVRYDPSEAATDRLVQQTAGGAPRNVSDVATRPTAVDEAAILARPLFARDRRPPPDGANAAAAPAGTLPRLAGIVIEDPTRLAIFQPKQSRPVVLTIGGEIAGQRIVAIDAGEVVTRGPLGEQRIEPLPDNAIVRVMSAPSWPPPIAIQPTAPQRRGEPRPHAGVFREETGFRIIDRTDN